MLRVAGRRLFSVSQRSTNATSFVLSRDHTFSDGGGDSSLPSADLSRFDSYHRSSLIRGLSFSNLGFISISIPIIVSTWWSLGINVCLGFDFVELRDVWCFVLLEFDVWCFNSYYSSLIRVWCFVSSSLFSLLE